MEIRQAVREWVEQRIGSDVEFADDDDIFELGLVNSLFALELVLFIEEEFQVTVENEDLFLGNFNTLENLEDFVRKKLAA